MCKNLVIFICFQIKNDYFLCYYIGFGIQKLDFCIQIYGFIMIFQLFY